MLEKHGDQYHPFRFGILMSTDVAETDQQARQECEEGVWYFLKNCLKGHLRREGRQLTYGPGVPSSPQRLGASISRAISPAENSWAMWKTGRSSTPPSRSSSAARKHDRRIQDLIESAKVGNLLIQFQLGNMPDHLARKSMKLFAEKVAPALRHVR